MQISCCPFLQSTCIQCLQWAVQRQTSLAEDHLPQNPGIKMQLAAQHGSDMQADRQAAALPSLAPVVVVALIRRPVMNAELVNSVPDIPVLNGLAAA